MKVAILGASGIGRNHARWFVKHGCHVSAILGSSPESLARATEMMHAQWNFEGQGYTDLGELLRGEQPDAVCIASPPTLHFAQALDCLEAGVHVLCEKPLVYAPGRPFRENRDGARQLVKLAAQKKLVLGTQLQYAGATPIVCKLADVAPSDVSDFAMELETSNPKSPRVPRDLWIDLGPHPLSMAQSLAGSGATLNEESVSFLANETDDLTELTVRFGVNCANGRYLSVRAILRAFDKNVHNRAPRRRFAFNGRVVSYEGLSDSNGNYHAEFTAPDGYTTRYDDPVDYLVGRFVRACRGREAIEIDGNFGVQNLEWLLKIADSAPASTRPTPETEAADDESFVDEEIAPLVMPSATLAALAASAAAASAASQSEDSVAAPQFVDEQNAIVSTQNEAQSFVDEPVVDELNADNLFIDEPIVENSIVDEPIVAEPIVENSFVDEPNADELFVDESNAENAFVDEPFAVAADAPAAFVDEAAPASENVAESTFDLEDEFGLDNAPAPLDVAPNDNSSDDSLNLDFFDTPPVAPSTDEFSLDLPVSPSDGMPIIDNSTPVPDLNFLDDFGFDETGSEATGSEAAPEESAKTAEAEPKTTPAADPFASFNLLD